MQKVGNLLAPVKDKVLLPTSSRNTSPKPNTSSRSSDSNNHCTPTINKLSQNSHLDPGKRPSYNSTPHTVNRSQTVPIELSSPNRSHFSPVSPLYVDNFPELGCTNKNQRKDKRQNSMTLGDFLTNQKQKFKPQGDRKRIKPTKLILDGQTYEGI